MNRIMLLLSVASVAPVCLAQDAPKPITDEQKKSLIAELSSVMDDTLVRKKEKLKADIAALTPLANDGNAAMDMFERSLKKVDYDSKPGMKEKDWRDWKTANRDNISSAANKRALQYQVRWALLCLEASQDDPRTFNTDKYKQRAADLLTEVIKDTEVMTEASSPFNGSVLNGPIGRACEIENYQPNDWPGSIMDFPRVIDSLVLKPARDKGDVAALRNGWNFVIAATKKTVLDMQEAAKKQARKAASAMPNAPGSERRNMARMIDMIAKEDVNTLNDTMEWAREVDCFMCGDELKASMNMFKILKGMKDPKRQEMLIGAMMMLMQRKDEIANSEESPWTKARKIRGEGQGAAPAVKAGGDKPGATTPARPATPPRPVVEEV